MNQAISLPARGFLQPGHLAAEAELPLSFSHWALAIPAACKSQQYPTVMLLPGEYLGQVGSQTIWVSQIYIWIYKGEGAVLCNSQFFHTTESRQTFPGLPLKNKQAAILESTDIKLWTILWSYRWGHGELCVLLWKTKQRPVLNLLKAANTLNCLSSRYTVENEKEGQPVGEQLHC